MVMAPPTRASTWQTGLVKSLGPHQRARCAGSVQSLKTVSRGASKTRTSSIARSESSSTGSFFALMSLLLLQLFEIAVQPIEALFPEAAVVLNVVGDFLERRGFQPARPPLGLPAARDEAGALQHLQVLRDRGQAHLKRPRKLGNRCFPARQARKDGPPRRIGKRGKDGAQWIGQHFLV